MAYQDIVLVEGQKRIGNIHRLMVALKMAKFWGRGLFVFIYLFEVLSGSLDIKSQIIARICAVENLINKGFSPKRTFYLPTGSMR
jgi:hypothetical protein